MTLDTTGTKITRKVESITEVFAKVGGISHILTFLSHFILMHYASMCFKVEAINALFNVKSDDNSILDEEGQVKVNLIDKWKLITGCFPKKKLSRFIIKGERRLI